MLRTGAPVRGMRALSPDDIFLSRLKLLIVMTKAFLQGFPLGEFRARAVEDNTRVLRREALLRAGKTLAGCDGRSGAAPEHLFLLRVELLAQMARRCIAEEAVGPCRREAIADNISHICSYLADKVDMEGIQFLKVA